MNDFNKNEFGNMKQNTKNKPNSANLPKKGLNLSESKGKYEFGLLEKLSKYQNKQ